MSERIMSVGRGMFAWRPDPPARSLRIDPETGWPLSWIIARTETFSSGEPIILDRCEKINRRRNS